MSLVISTWLTFANRHNGAKELNTDIAAPVLCQCHCVSVLNFITDILYFFISAHLTLLGLALGDFLPVCLSLCVSAYPSNA